VVSSEATETESEPSSATSCSKGMARNSSLWYTLSKCRWMYASARAFMDAHE
jgi:hypothetical protein